MTDTPQIPPPTDSPNAVDAAEASTEGLSVREIEALIPHRWPFLLVDRIVEYDADAKRIVGIKAVTATEWYFQGHFPGLPVMPGVLQVEALAQTLGIYVGRLEQYAGQLGLFAAIDGCRFRRARCGAVPGLARRGGVAALRLGSAHKTRRDGALRRVRCRGDGDP